MNESPVVAPGKYPLSSEPLPPIPGLETKKMVDPRVVEKIRVIENACLAVSYSANHYERIAKGIPQFNILAFYNDILVGCLTARLEEVNDDSNNATETVFRLYIMTISTLKPYRRLGIGSHMLDNLLRTVRDEKDVCISGVHLNAQVSATEALSFYKKFNFEVVELRKDYYVGLDCRDAYSLRLIVPQPFLEKNNKKKQ